MAYTKKSWDRKTELILSPTGKYYRRYKKQPHICIGINANRDRCKKRDNVTCQICGRMGFPLVAHHLDHLNYPKVLNANHRLENLLTLCYSCHIKLHYGVLAKHKSIKVLRDSGLTFQQIADSFNVSRQRIHQIYTKNKNASKAN